MSDIFVTMAAADTLIVTPIVDRVLGSVIVGIKGSLIDTAVAATV